MNRKTLFLRRKPNELILLIIGMCFFANPMLSLLDFLPDFIGCLIIMAALSRFTAISADIECAYKYFKYMMLISLARIFVFFLNPGFDDVMSLCMTLLFAVIEFICAFMAIPALYDGLSQMSIKYNGKAKDYPEFKQICFIFFAVRGFASILPHITSIFTDSEDSIITNEAMVTASYTALLTLVNIVITTIVAVFFVIAIISYIGRLSRDTQMRKSAYADISAKNAEDPDYFVRRSLTSALKMLSLSFIFFIDFFGDNKNFIPDFLFGFFAVIAIFKMKNYLENSRPVIASGIVYTVLSIVSHTVYNGFMARRGPVLFNRILQNFLVEYIIAIAVAFVETIALIVFISKLAKYLKPIATEYSIQTVPSEFKRLSAELEETSMLQLRDLKRLRSFGVWIALFGTALPALMHLTFYYDIPYWMLHVGINALFFIYSYVILNRLRDGVLKRYERPEDVI